MKNSYLTLIFAVLMILCPYSVQATKISSKKGSPGYTDFIFFSVRTSGDTYRIEESYTYSGGECFYVVDMYRPGNQNDMNRNTKSAPKKTEMNKCFAKYKVQNEVCNVMSEYDDVVDEVPYFRCFSNKDSLANNGWEIVRNELNNSWKMATLNDVRILEKNVLSEAIGQVDPELSKLNRKGINCKFEMVETSYDERNMVAREMSISRILIKRDIDQADVRYEITEVNQATGKKEVAKALVCKVPHEFRFSDRSEFDLKKKEIDTTFNLKQILKDVGIELKTPEEKSI